MTILLRDGVAADVPAILGLVRDLAAFEQAPDAVKATEADLLRDGFGPIPRFHVRLVELDGRPAGFTLWFFNYSTWEGRPGIFLEDLFVAEWARGRGLGRRLIEDLAAIAVKHQATRLDLSVLDWNPARGFYEKIGFRWIKNWLPYRLSGEALEKLATSS